MESGITSDFKPAGAETGNVENTDSADSFQSFIYELFEKNGILNDLRAYLRGHIINVLKSAQTGEPPLCQKNFTQRLDLPYQALNMLIAEYLMRLKFNYSFSVFVSEIPLANMVFGFAKALMEKVDENSLEMRFTEGEVWSVLNYLGLQCDSEHASNILQMYNNEPETPLLLCILRGMPMYKECVTLQGQSANLAESAKSSNSAVIEPASYNDLPECSHCAYCTKCQNRMCNLKDRYKKKKNYLLKNAHKKKSSASVSPANSENVVKNISIVERSLIQEMFQQMKSVYETEVEMVMAEEEKKVRRTVATHAMQLQQKRNELEETFKARQLELENVVQHKKKFLWGLARSLRDQHAHVARAMQDVRDETERLGRKENSLKNQLAEAEQILKKRGEEMREQIAILEAHLESMKRERENISRERSELERLKSIQDSASEVTKVTSVEVHSHYDLLKSELEILKMYLKSSQMQAKCVIERGTITEADETVPQTNMTLNNTQGNEKASKSDDFDERVKMNQVINDFRKKNVNLSQSNLDEIYHERSRDRSRSSNSSEAGDAAAPDLELERGRDRDRDRDLIQRLREENDRLRACARQRAVPTPAPRPRTAPPAHAQDNVHATVSGTTMDVGWRKGAGEELSMFSDAQPRILVPGDTLPFIGVLRDKHGSTRRPAVAGRSRALSGVSKRAVTPVRERHVYQAPGAGSSAQAEVPEASCSLQRDETFAHMHERLQPRPRAASGVENRNEEKSHMMSLHKDAKENQSELRNDSRRELRSPSPSGVLRDAKRRLRRLELEAEAVEQSYRDFRRRKELRRPAPDPPAPLVGLADTLDITRTYTPHELDRTIRDDIEMQFTELQTTVRSDFDKYMRDYKTKKFDFMETKFRNKPSVLAQAQPIPDAVAADYTERAVRGNYIEAPLTEFRKLYTSARRCRRDDTDATNILSNNGVTKADFDYENSALDALRKEKQNREAELQILRQNINKIYHSPSRESVAAENPQICQASADHENELRVEVESVSEVNDIKSQSQELLLVVQSSVNSHNVTTSGGEVASEVFSAHMTIIVSPKRSPEAQFGPSPPHAELSPQHADFSPKRATRSPPHDFLPMSADRSPQRAVRRQTGEDSSPQRADNNPLRAAHSPQNMDRSPQHADSSHQYAVSSPHFVDHSPNHTARAVRSPQHAARSPPPEQAAHLTRNDVLDAIFHADPNNVSSIQMQLALSKEEVDDKGDYTGDFVVDENYIDHSDTDHSRISLPAMEGGDMADDNFWDT